MSEKSDLLNDFFVRRYEHLVRISKNRIFKGSKTNCRDAHDLLHDSIIDIIDHVRIAVVEGREEHAISLISRAIKFRAIKNLRGFNWFSEIHENINVTEQCTDECSDVARECEAKFREDSFVSADYFALDIPMCMSGSIVKVFEKKPKPRIKYAVNLNSAHTSRATKHEAFMKLVAMNNSILQENKQMTPNLSSSPATEKTSRFRSAYSTPQTNN